MAELVGTLFLLAVAGWLGGLVLLVWAEWSDRADVWETTRRLVPMVAWLIVVCAALTAAVVVVRAVW
jgi:hypothetical protein